MMGERRVIQEALFYGFSLERHVPDDHLLRKIDRFVDLSGLASSARDASTAVRRRNNTALAFTWLIDRVEVAPFLVVTTPEMRCGKSQLLGLVGSLSHGPLPDSRSDISSCNLPLKDAIKLF
jgi:hypothetical protein